MESDVAAGRAALVNLVVDGDNLLGNAAGPDLCAQLRRNYLNWRQRVEATVTRVRLAPPAETQRHRDIVRDAVPDDRIFAEVEAEVRVTQRHLRDLADRPATMPGGEETFTSDRGTLYRYDPTRQLGRAGSYGRVYPGWDVAGTELAVKEVMIRTDPDHVVGEWRLVNRELEAARRASERPGLLPVVDDAHLDDRLLIVMPRAERSLADAIHAGLTADDSTAAIRDIANALHQLSVVGIVHRDIKPGNVLWWNARWCVGDFGIARILDAATATYTWEGTGTAEYRAPELWRGEPATTLSDLYALGCVAAELLTGRVVFPGPDYRNQHERTMPDLPADVDPQLARVVLQLLAKQPEARPQAARSVLEQLQPSAGLTNAHHALRRRAALAERRNRDAEASEASRRHREQLRDRAREVLRQLWHRTADDIRRAVPDATTSETPEGHFLAVADTRIAAVNITDCKLDDVLAVADVVIHDGHGSPPQLVANLVAEANGVPRWALVRWHRNDISPETFEPGLPGHWAGLEYAEFVRQWPLEQLHIAPLIRRTTEANPEVLRDLLARVVEGGNEP